MRHTAPTILLLVLASLCTAADQARINELVLQLGADEPAKREQAQSALSRVGAPAREALERAAMSTDAEIVTRARTLLGIIDARFVTLDYVRRTYLIGEPIPVHWVFRNITDETLKLSMGSDLSGRWRASKFTIRATDVRGRPLEDPLPPELRNRGGNSDSPKLAPGEQYTVTLDLARYIRFDRAGTYQVTISHDLGWKKDERTPPTATLSLRIAEPTPAQAALVIERVKQLPAEPQNKPGKRGRVKRDFRLLGHPLYLPLIKSDAIAGDVDAIAGLAGIQTLSSTQTLLDILFSQAAEDAAVRQACWDALTKPTRFPDSPKTKPGPTWDATFTPRLRELAIRWSRLNDVDSLAHAGTIIKAHGTKDDLPILFDIMTRIVALDTPNTFDDTRIYQFNRHLEKLLRATETLYKRGAKRPTDPKTDGELMTVIRDGWRSTSLRTKDWPTHFERGLTHPHPLVQYVSLNYVPRKLKEQFRPPIANLINHRIYYIARKARRAAGDNPHPSFVEPIKQAIHHTLSTGQSSTYLDKAAKANGITRDQILEIGLEHVKGDTAGRALIHMIRTVVGRTGGSSWRSSLDEDVRKETIQHWKGFIEKNRQALREGKTFKPGDPELPEHLLPEGISITFDRKRWPSR